MGQARPGEIYSFRILGGGYGAAQVIAARPDGNHPTVQLLLLDLDSALPPGPSEVAASAAESAIVDENDCLWVPAFVPWWAQRIGEASVRPPASSNESYGGWEGIAIGALLARMKRAGHRVSSSYAATDQMTRTTRTRMDLRSPFSASATCGESRGKETARCGK